MKKNNSGFTLIELLAVIVILAVLVLMAMPRVLQFMENARRDTFKVEVQNILNKMESVYADKMLNGGLASITETVDGSKIPTKYMCLTLQDLYKDGYMSKNFDSAGYSGIIEVFIPSKGDVVYGINITNGSYSYRLATPDKLATDSNNDGMGNETKNDNSFPVACDGNKPIYTYAQYKKAGFTP
ncbi:MAG: type II secretion system protein [Bacilli bacterium]